MIGLLWVLLLPTIELAVTIWGWRILCAVTEPLGDAPLSQSLERLCEVLQAVLILLLTAGAIVLVFLTTLSMAGGIG